MKKTVLFSLVLSGAVAAGFTSCDKMPKASLNTEIDSVSYFIGTGNAKYFEQTFAQDSTIQVKEFLKGFRDALKADSTNKSYDMGFSEAANYKRNLATLPDSFKLNVDNILAAMVAAFDKDTTVVISEMEGQRIMQQFQQKVQAYQMREQEAAKKIEEDKMANSEAALKAKADGAKFLSEKEKEAGVVKTESGLLYKVVKEGKGEKPTASDRVKVNYKGTLVDGTEFDSSYKRNQPAEFAVGQVIKGWQEGLQLMAPGAKYEFYIPYELAYNVNAPQNIGPCQTLVFEVELLDVVK